MLSIQYAAMENTVFATTSYEKKICETQFMSPNMTEIGKLYPVSWPVTAGIR